MGRRPGWGWGLSSDLALRPNRFPCCHLSHPQLLQPVVLQNKAPHWNEGLRCWCLNFRGRVKLASVKNFQVRYGPVWFSLVRPWLHLVCAG